MKLYELPERYKAWMNKVEAQDGEVNDGLFMELEKIEGDVATKIDAYCALIRQYKYEEQILKEEAAAMRIKMATAIQRQERLKLMILSIMQSMDIQILRGKRFWVHRRNNHKNPSISWDSNERIPEPYRNVIETFNAEKAHEDYNAGIELPPGVKIVSKEHLMIK